MKRFFKKITFLLVFIIIVSSIQSGNAYAAPRNKKYVWYLLLSKRTLRISLGSSKSLPIQGKWETAKPTAKTEVPVNPVVGTYE